MVKSLNTILIALVCCLVTLGIYDQHMKTKWSTIEMDHTRLVSQSEKNHTHTTKKHLLDNNPNLVIPANKAKNAVVAIEAIKIKKERFKSDKYSRSNGSGVIISDNGFVVTNYHVVEDAEDIKLLLEDRRELMATLEGFDLSTDIALLKIDAEDLPYLEFGNSDHLQIGEWVMAVGNPFKLSSSVTAGIVSAKGRDINIFSKQGIESLIQTDAAINPGNSGGALVNTSGELVGINTAIMTYGGKYEGFSFAVPSSLVEKVTKDLMEHGAVQRAWLGVGILNVNEKRAKTLHLEKIEGVFVDLVEKSSAASKAGLIYEDVIVAINGKPTLSKPTFLEILGQHRPGDNIEIELIRRRQRIKVMATLHNQMNTTDFIAVRKDKLFTDLGFELRDLDSEERDRNEKSGVMVVSIIKDSKIASVNMDPGYIITSVNGKQISNVRELKKMLESEEGEIYLNGYYENYPMEWPYKFSK